MMLELLLVAPSEQMLQHVPGGFLFTNEVFTAAKMSDSISHRQRMGAELERTLGYLVRRYPQRIRVRRLNLWSLGGLWATVRFRIRSFPALIINRQRLLTDDELEFRALREIVDAYLSHAYQDTTE